MIRLVVAIVLVVGCGAPEGATVRITVPSGATPRAVADTLAAHEIIGDTRWFLWYARLTGNDREIKAGVYDIPRAAGARSALVTLVRGAVATTRFVTPEGLMLDELADAANRQLGIAVDAFLAAASDPDLVARVGARGSTLEGYLYPSTYVVRVGTSAREVVEQMAEQFEANWDEAWNDRLDSLGWSRDELVTLASIIEGEVRHPEDRPYVSSVYHNRLRRNMRLQADPTVIYALGVRRRLFTRDYDTVSDYNTYLIDGLPPHPIGQPSVASLEAALYPASSDFYYFVADRTGRHVFSRTYREHRATIRQVRSTR